MLKNVICFVLIIKLTQARYGYMPKFYGQDSTIIVDANKPPPINNNVAVNYRNKLRLPAPFPLWRHYPRYHIIPSPPSPAQIFSINTWARAVNTKPLNIATIEPTTTSSTSTSTSTTATTTPSPGTWLYVPERPEKSLERSRAVTTTPTTTTPKPTTFYITSAPFVTDDEFPKELLNIAQNKLGLKSLDEIPSISELGQLLGTNTPKETINYIKQLTANEQGVAFMKAYIESADYTDNSGDLDNRNEDEEDENVTGNIEEATKIYDSDLVVISDEDSNNDYDLETTTLMPRKLPKIMQKPKKMPQKQQSFLDRVTNFMQLNTLVDKKSAERKIDENYGNELTRMTEMGQNIIKKIKPAAKDILENQTEAKMLGEPGKHTNYNFKTPMLVRESTLPYNYPVPIRIASPTTNTVLPPSSMNSPNVNSTPPVHLNTPKILIPHVQQLSRVTKIPAKKIEDFLASKPKLMELATKVSRFPIGYDRNSPVEAQVIAAVQKAIEKDEDLKKLLSATATLK